MCGETFWLSPPRSPNPHEPMRGLESPHASRLKPSHAVTFWALWPLLGTGVSPSLGPPGLCSRQSCGAATTGTVCLALASVLHRWALASPLTSTTEPEIPVGRQATSKRGLYVRLFERCSTGSLGMTGCRLLLAPPPSACRTRQQASSSGCAQPLVGLGTPLDRAAISVDGDSSDGGITSHPSSPSDS